jgi:hypothetical protein
MDGKVGVMVDALRTKGIYDNTVLFFRYDRHCSLVAVLCRAVYEYCTIVVPSVSLDSTMY